MKELHAKMKKNKFIRKDVSMAEFHDAGDIYMREVCDGEFIKLEFYSPQGELFNYYFIDREQALDAAYGLIEALEYYENE